ncbi:uncharacterized protein LOC120624487 [Pararge aegeria]|uniref:Uncharacterized protein n=1 Tax=Pararge aegeria TaxID=116150 RepID=S4PS32_9NEOP|nr:uncharacterized protein LOC120624487 [Pararge aegeria]
MSSALVREALAFVDQEETKVRSKKRRVERSRPQHIGQVSSHPYKQKNKKQTKSIVKTKVDIAEENIKKFLVLSSPTANKAVAEKIVQRAIKGKPLADKIEIKVTEEKSILFPEDDCKKIKRRNRK